MICDSRMKLLLSLFSSFFIILFSGCSEKAPEWKSIFNGENLDGWTIKICGAPLGENFKNTFVVEDGMMRVKYDEYETFSNEYAHIYYNEKLSNYKLRLEFKFNGTRVPGGKSFTELNSGVMFHSQSAESMKLDQEFPVSVEAQFLASLDPETSDRRLMNIATPGTHIVNSEGVLHTDHMTFSGEKTRHRDEWVQVEIEVHGSDLVIHRVEGKEVLRYTNPQLGGTQFLPKDYPLPVGTLLKDGYIALQGESHPVDFRNIELMILPE